MCRLFWPGMQRVQCAACVCMCLFVCVYVCGCKNKLFCHSNLTQDKSHCIALKRVESNRIESIGVDRIQSKSKIGFSGQLESYPYLLLWISLCTRAINSQLRNLTSLLTPSPPSAHGCEVQFNLSVVTGQQQQQQRQKNKTHTHTQYAKDSTHTHTLLERKQFS